MTGVQLLTDDQKAVVEAVGRIIDRFDDDYWRKADEQARFPVEYTTAMAEGGWLGIAMPEDVGGAGLGLTEAALMMNRVANSAGGMAASSSIHINIFGLNPVVVFGNEEQRRRFLPPLIAGKERACFGVTEPDAGLDTGRIKTAAVRDGDVYRITGRKIWTSTAQEADRVLIIARTSPIDSTRKPTDGLTLFYAPLDRSKVEIRAIHKMGRHAVDSNMLFIDGLEVPVADRIGEEGQGFKCLLHGLNPERVMIAAEAVGIGRQALSRAVTYAKERVVFGRPIGQNQGIQHPLAENWMELEAAWLMVLRAAALYDAGEPCGAEANAAKYLAAEAAFKACERAVMTLGGMGYAAEYGVERLFREVLINRIAPVSPELIKCFIAERVLGLPKSY
ncbi:acyl-CoA dehydrogenase [Thalassobaculum fulvum]|uniref:Acyl-CoA dehydrogenase n=1 Tax=Thalassobaculum fulvum TaxID=1633335 RepID=A0A918XRA9_9PROT|nr:acyl-CoA dehydrogenase family protein [Thalassobaculum fulvum]GHD49364.1 acyl-CoA dehydrogenase [Thalassobaculum fulvum]